MEEIVDGLRYDTEKASLVASDCYFDGSNWDRNGRNTYLYRTMKGAFFRYETSRWQGERDYICPVSDDCARRMYENLREREMTYAEAFGVEPEDA